LPLHEAAPHWVPVPYISQAPALQLPVVPQLVAVVVAHSDPGSVPSVTFAHSPVVWPVREAVHALHVPAQSLLQHTPSTQKPVVQSEPARHVRP
jgi:hypothetical protein